MEACRFIPSGPRLTRRGATGHAAGRKIKLRRLIALGMVLLAIAGCSQNRQQTATLERENRELEDAMWQLHFDKESLEDENDRLREESGLELRQRSPKRDMEPSSAVRRNNDKQGDKQGDSAPLDLDDFRPPVVELPGLPQTSDGASGDTAVPPEEFPDGLTVPHLEMPATEDSNRSARDTSFPEVTGNSQDVAWITLIQTETTGIDLDDRPGDDGITVVVQPRDRNQQLVPAAADVSVVLLDRSRQGQAARVARWDFTAAESAQNFHDGIRLQMPWPERPPRSELLHLFVRSTTRDGGHLQPGTPIELDLTGRKARGWTATHTPRPHTPIDRALGRPEVLETASLPRVRLPKPTVATAAAPRLARQPPVWSPNRF